MTLKERIIDNYGWMRGYNRSFLTSDMLTAIMLTVLLVPQALAYAMLADLPPQAGIYAAIFPPVIYAFFGSSRMLSVGPVAIVSIMTAYAIGSFPPELRVISAAMLAMLSGGFLMVFGLLRGGAVSTFFSRPVVTAYISGAALLIILSQFKNLLQINVSGSKISELLPSVLANLGETHALTAFVGLGTIALLWGFKRFVVLWLRLLHVKKRKAQLVGKLGPIIVVALSTLATVFFKLDTDYGLATVGYIPASLPHLNFPVANLDHWRNLILAALLISLVGFVDSVSVAQTLAAKLRHRVDPNKELLGLGAANAVAGLTGGYPVAGSLSRSAFNFSSGAKSPLVGVFAAILMCIAVLTIMPLLQNLPLAVLAGMIIHSCFGLFNLKSIWRTWCYSKADATTAIGALLAVLLLGVQYGVLVGTALSMIFHIRLTLKPHTVVVGRFLGTEHYRDVERYPVEELDEIKTLRIDESLYFANARFLEDTVSQLVQSSPKLTDMILMCPAVNRIDASALQSLEEINQRLAAANIRLHLSEIHTNVMDRLHRSDFLEKLTGNVYISQHEAIEALRPEPDWSQFSDHVDMH